MAFVRLFGGAKNKFGELPHAPPWLRAVDTAPYYASGGSIGGWGNRPSPAPLLPIGAKLAHMQKMCKIVTKICIKLNHVICNVFLGKRHSPLPRPCPSGDHTLSPTFSP